MGRFGVDLGLFGVGCVFVALALFVLRFGGWLGVTVGMLGLLFVFLGITSNGGSEKNVERKGDVGKIE